MNDQTNPVATETTEPKLTPREKLLAKYNKLNEKATALAAEITAVVQAINEIDAIAAIGEGTAVLITVGKGEEAQEIPGVVVGVKEDEDGGKVFKVQYGTGFDADIAVVKQGRIKLAPQPDAAEFVAE